MKRFWDKVNKTDIAQDIIAGTQREAAKAYHPSSQGRA